MHAPIHRDTKDGNLYGTQAEECKVLKVYQLSDKLPIGISKTCGIVCK